MRNCVLERVQISNGVRFSQALFGIFRVKHDFAPLVDNHGPRQGAQDCRRESERHRYDHTYQ